MVRVIAMLTHNDQTVGNALHIYEDNNNAKTHDWGFKDTNISEENARALAARIRTDGNEYFFESLVTTEKEALQVSELAVECKADYIIGMEYFDEVNAYLKSTDVKYFPTCGRRAGYPVRMLYGEIEEIIDDAERIIRRGVDGISLSVFRYADGDPLELAENFVKAVKAPLILTGSINSDERLDFVKKVSPWGFTIGSALFNSGDFPGDKIADKLDYIYDYLRK